MYMTIKMILFSNVFHHQEKVVQRIKKSLKRRDYCHLFTVHGNISKNMTLYVDCGSSVFAVAVAESSVM
jgi:hypothetical protein